MSNPENKDPGPPSIEEFLGEPTRDLGDWRWLWEGDHTFPVTSDRGALGSAVVWLKRLLRPVVKAPQADLWDRQRTFNLVTIEYLEQLSETLQQVRNDLVRDLREVRSDLLRDVQNNHRRISHLEAFKREGFGDVMRHSDALYAVVDQKLDRYRRQSEELWSRLESLLARVGEVSEATARQELATGIEEQAYLGLEDRFRGTQTEIGERVAAFLPHLPVNGEVLDLGCGRGEMLKVLSEHGFEARGVDLNAEMVEQCRSQGLQAERADLFQALMDTPGESLAGVISLHVIEHLPATALGRLVRLAWQALSPGGLLILETPNPLSMVVAARNFWRDPTHLRPIHPDTLQLVFGQAGFDPVEFLELRPFATSERLPEVPVSELAPEARPLAERINELRDRLDDLLYGCQDYAILGKKPEQV